jgi:FMN phosphatase YigB (HAD superfamily)
MAVKAVVFDFGYTLVNEDRVWRECAAEHGWPDSVFFAALGAAIERRSNHRAVFELLGVPGGPGAMRFEPGDFYDDALDALRTTKEAGHVVGIAGNMGVEIEEFVAEHVDVDFIASSAGWGVAKPAAGFFEHIAEAAQSAPADVTYIGDRLDNDVLPATRAGMRGVWLLRGPWAALQRSWPEAQKAVLRIDNLGALPL